MCSVSLELMIFDRVTGAVVTGYTTSFVYNNFYFYKNTSQPINTGVPV